MSSYFKTLLVMTTFLGQMVAFGQWNSIEVDTDISFTSSYFLNDQKGYISGYKTDFTGTIAEIYKTEDAGLNWELVKSIDIAGHYVSEMSWISEDYVYMGTQSTFDDGVLLVSNNGAQDLFWVHSLPSEDGVKSISFLNQTTGFVVTDLDNFYVTTDSGDSWDFITPSVSGGDLIINKILALSTNVILVAGSDASGNTAKIYRTTNQGNSWNEVYSIFDNNGASVKDIDISSIAHAVVQKGNSVLTLKSIDGISWSIIGSTLNNSIGRSISSLDNSHSYLSYYDTNSQENKVNKIINDSPSEEIISEGDTSIFEIHYINDELGLAFGKYGTIKRWTPPTGVNNQQREILSVYPNPSNGEFRINNLSYDMNIEVYDLRGQLVSRNYSIESDLISLTNLGKGIYFLKVVSNNKVALFQKIIIE